MPVPVIGSRRTLAAAAIAVAFGGAAGRGVLAVRGEAPDTTPATAATLLARADRDVQAVAARLAAAESLAQMRSVGRGAADRARHVSELVDRSNGLAADNLTLGPPVRDALTADTAALTAVGRLATLKPSSLETSRPVLADIRQGVEDIALRHRGLRGLPLPVGYQDPSAELRSASGHATKVLRRARKKLANWRTRYRKAAAVRREALAVLDSYRRTMLGYLRTYDDLRDEMSTWIGKVDSTGVTFEEAYDVLAAASSARSRVRRGIATLDAPAAIATDHNTLLQVVADSVAAVDNAYDGTLDYEFDYEGAYGEYRDAPGWQSFTAQSDQVASRYATARAAWNRDLAKTRKKLSNRALPKAPQV